MSSVRGLKKDIDYLVNEVISDCYVSLYFNGEKKKDAVVAIISEAAELHNSLIYRVNHPAEKKNKSLVRKHYAQIRRDLFAGIDSMFVKLSEVCK